MSHLKPFIERVLNKRQAWQNKLQTVEGHLRELNDQLGRLQHFADEATAKADIPQDFQQRAGALTKTLDGLHHRIKEVMAKTANLQARFSKNTINIGVAGRARQGKSTILKTISGLSDLVIPTSDGLPCTGAKSRIIHQNDDPHAVIEFYNETEFLHEIVHAYYKELQLPNPPEKLSKFANSLPPKPNYDNPELHAIYGKLRKLHSDLNAYRSYLSKSPQRISLDLVRNYVSQEDGRMLYVAVRCAHIYVQFPNSDITGLAIVDLPGLGEIAKGHSEKLVTSLQQEIDAVILVKRPSEDGDDWFAPDIKVFNVIKQAVPELDLADWLFVVLNADGRNSKQVELLRSLPPDIGSSPRLLAVNCTRPDEVHRGVFLEVLRHLEQNLERLDMHQISKLTESVNRLENDLSSAVQPIFDYLQRNIIDTEDYQKFRELSSAFLRQLRMHLDNLTNEYREIVFNQSKASELHKTIDEACNKAEATVPLPSADELKGMYHDLGGWKAVVQQQLHHLRTYLTRCLAEILDQWLNSMIMDAQRKIMCPIIEGPLWGILSEEIRQSKDPRLQLEVFRQLLAPDQQRTLLSGVDYLLGFTFSYQSHFHYRVRNEMNPLDPMALREPGDLHQRSAVYRLAACLLGPDSEAIQQRFLFYAEERFQQGHPVSIAPIEVPMPDHLGSADDPRANPADGDELRTRRHQALRANEANCRRLAKLFESAAQNPEYLGQDVLIVVTVSPVSWAKTNSRPGCPSCSDSLL